MRFRFFAALSLSAAALAAQTSEETRTLAFANLAEPRQIQEFVNTARAIADISRIAADPDARSLALTATGSQIALAEWLLAELDRRRAPRPAAFETHDAAFADARAPAVKVCYLAHAVNPQQLQEAVNAVRSLAEVQRVMVFNSLGAIILRGNAEQAAFAEWLLRDADAAAAGAAPRETRQYTYPDSALPDPERRTTSVRVYHPAAITTPADIQEAIVALRSIGDVQRVVALAAGPVIAVRGAAVHTAVTDWLMTELDRPAPASGNHEFQSPGLNGETIRLLFPSKAKTPPELQAAVNLVRQSTGIQRAVMCPRLHALVLRGTPEQIAAAARLVP